MKSLTFTFKDGSITEFSPDTLIAFVDETGDELFADPVHPVFGLGGCCVLASDYEKLIHLPWQQLKNEFFPDVKVMHANKVSKNITSKQIHILNHYFQNFQIFRVAAITSKKTLFSEKVNPYEICASSLMNRFCDIAQHVRFSRFVIVFESSTKGDKLAQQYFSSFTSFDSGNVNIPIDKFLMPKSSACSGLEIADFVMHAVGRQARKNVKQSSFEKEKDFESVFSNIDSRLVSFIDISNVTKN